MFAGQYDMEEVESEPKALDWTQAKCRDGAASMTGLFFSEEIGEIARAKQICTTCALQPACLAGAIERREPWGVWGGQLFFNGKILAQKRKRGRPPKNPPVNVTLTA